MFYNCYIVFYSWCGTDLHVKHIELVSASDVQTTRTAGAAAAAVEVGVVVVVAAAAIDCCCCCCCRSWSSSRPSNSQIEDLLRRRRRAISATWLPSSSYQRTCQALLAFRHVSRLLRHTAKQRSERLSKKTVELKPKLLQSLCGFWLCREVFQVRVVTLLFLFCLSVVRLPTADLSAHGISTEDGIFDPTVLQSPPSPE